jgi:hypothetical protein
MTRSWSRQEQSGRGVLLEGRTVRVHDVQADPEYAISGTLNAGIRTMLGVFSAAAMRPVATTPVLKSRRSPSASNAANMSERGDIWLSRSFSVTCILSVFIGAVTVGMLSGEPDVSMLFGAVGGAMVGAVFFFVIAGVIRLLFDRENP